MGRLTFGRVQLYIEPRDIWMGVYVAPDAVYVCPLPLVVIKLRRFRRGAELIGGNLPKPGTRAETHFIEIGPSPFHAGMLSWACSCCEGANRSFGDLGRAAADAVAHIPGGERWTIEPADKLIGGPVPGAAAPYRPEVPGA